MQLKGYEAKRDDVEFELNGVPIKLVRQPFIVWRKIEERLPYPNEPVLMEQKGGVFTTKPNLQFAEKHKQDCKTVDILRDCVLFYFSVSPEMLEKKDISFHVEHRTVDSFDRAWAETLYKDILESVSLVDFHVIEVELKRVLSTSDEAIKLFLADTD